MKFIDRLMGRTSTKEQPAEHRAIDRHTAPSLLRSWAETPTAGVAVTTRSALSIPSVFAAVSSVADTISTLPLPVYTEGADGPVKLREHAVHQLLNVSPNRVQTAKAYRAAMVVDLMAEGEHFSEVQRDGAGNPVALYRIDPCDVQTKWVEDAGAYVLEYSVGGSIIPAENLLHVLGFSSNGFRGESPFRLCQNSLSFTLALDQYGGSFIRQGARPAGILNIPVGMDEVEKEDARKRWVEANSGSDKAGKTVILPDGFKFEPMSIDPEASQFHDSRVQQMRDCQRITKTPPHVSNDYERQTWNNIQHARMVFVEQSIRPLCVAIEQAVNKVLLNNDGNVWAEHVVEGILRGSFSEQITSLSEAIASGIYTVNEARALFNLPPLDQPTTQPQESNGNTLAV